MSAPAKGGWTQGPWQVLWAGNPPKLEPYEIRTEGRDRILRWGAFIKPGSATAVANARLIAAAPDMFEALEGLLGAYVALDTANIGDADCSWASHARAALAKALGQ